MQVHCKTRGNLRGPLTLCQPIECRWLAVPRYWYLCTRHIWLRKSLLLFFSPLLFLNYFLSNLFLFLQKSGWGGGGTKAPSPFLCAVPDIENTHIVTCLVKCFFYIFFNSCVILQASVGSLPAIIYYHLFLVFTLFQYARHVFNCVPLYCSMFSASAYCKRKIIFLRKNVVRKTERQRFLLYVPSWNERVSTEY